MAENNAYCQPSACVDSKLQTENTVFDSSLVESADVETCRFRGPTPHISRLGQFKLVLRVNCTYRRGKQEKARIQRCKFQRYLSPLHASHLTYYLTYSKGSINSWIIHKDTESLKLFCWGSPKEKYSEWECHMQPYRWCAPLFREIPTHHWEWHPLETHMKGPFSWKADWRGISREHGWLF